MRWLIIRIKIPNYDSSSSTAGDDGEEYIDLAYKNVDLFFSLIINSSSYLYSIYPLLFSFFWPSTSTDCSV